MYGKVQDRSPLRIFINSLLFSKLVETELDELADLRLIVRV